MFRDEGKLKQYPIRVPGEGYSGADPRKRRKAQEYNRVARLVEQYLNTEVEKWPDDTASSVLSYQVASAIGEDNDLVHRIIFRIDGGSGGVTIWKGDYERALARTMGS